MYNVTNMTDQPTGNKTALKPKKIASKPRITAAQLKATPKDTTTKKKSHKWILVIGIASVVLTVLMCVAIIVYKDEVKELQNYGYLGAFFISILGGATVIVPVPMLLIVFTLGGVMPYPWLVAIMAALGELVGAITIYFTGRSAGHALSQSKHGWIQKTYDKVMSFVKKRAAVTLFVVTSIINPFFYPAAFAAGAMKFKIRNYILVVLAGKLIKSFTVVYAGVLGIKFIFHWFGIDI
jgi:membrane protein YqaA with SNARE-associated domain